jgi:plastocyanin
VQKNAQQNARSGYPGAMLKLRYLLVAATVAGALFAGATQAASHKVTKLYGQSGPGFTITLKKANFVPVRTLKPGTYTFVIQDRSTIHNYHLKGPGVDKKTSVPFLGTKTWANVKVKKGKYIFVCDPHKANMHGSFTVK